ncbi:dnaJ homolog subfamily C member 11-like [Sycon ciliatum]|uniref:dnaJ homolog subfamily C member 11-like n=1 Tax=Sycon ciliatum TaxID=27933 RepID=UPI0031F6D0C5
MAEESSTVEGSLYAVLNVPQNASEEEIRSAYRRLSVVFHPDKHASSSEDDRQTADNEFQRIKYAYEVLSDRSRRDIYDLYGLKGLQADWDVVPRVATGLEMLEVYDRIRRLRQEEYVQKLSKPCGKAVIRCDVREIGRLFAPAPTVQEYQDDEFDDDEEYFMDDDDDEADFLDENNAEQSVESERRLADVASRPAVRVERKTFFDGNTGLPFRLQGIAVEQTLDVALSPYDSMSYTCNVATTGEERGWGTVGAVFRHTLTTTPLHSSSLHCGVQVGHVPQLSVGGHLSLPSSCFVYADAAWRPWSHQPLCILPRVHVGRQFTSDVVGKLEFQQCEKDSPSGEQSLRLVVQRDSYYGNLRTHLSLGPERPPSIGVRYSPKLLSSLDGLLQVQANVEGVHAAAGLEQAVSPMTRLGMRVQASFPGGIELTLRCRRGDQRLIFPVTVSDDVSLSALLYSTFVPLTVFFLLRECVIRPYGRMCAAEEARLRSALLESELSKKRKENEAFVQLMTETYQNSVAAEQNRRGLVIRNAWYGRLVSSSNDSEDSSQTDQDGEIVDVTVALQCLVKDSRLLLYDTDKSSLPGFYDPAPQQPKKLRVRYEFRGKLHEVTVGDSEPLQLPKQSHTL